MPQPGTAYSIHYDCGCWTTIGRDELVLARMDCDDCRAKALEWLTRLVQEEGSQLTLLTPMDPSEPIVLLTEKPRPVGPFQMGRVPAHCPEAKRPPKGDYDLLARPLHIDR